MGLIRVPFTAEVAATFFRTSPLLFQVTDGVPSSAQLVDIMYLDGEGSAVFEHPFFPDNVPGEKLPIRNVEWTAFAPTEEEVVNEG